MSGNEPRDISGRCCHWKTTSAKKKRNKKEKKPISHVQFDVTQLIELCLSFEKNRLPHSMARSRPSFFFLFLTTCFSTIIFFYCQRSKTFAPTHNESPFFFLDGRRKNGHVHASKIPFSIRERKKTTRKNKKKSIKNNDYNLCRQLLSIHPRVYISHAYVEFERRLNKVHKRGKFRRVLPLLDEKEPSSKGLASPFGIISE